MEERVQEETSGIVEVKNDRKTIVKQIILFVLTFISTTYAGAELCFGKSLWAENYSFADFFTGAGCKCLPRGFVLMSEESYAGFSVRAVR